MKQTPRIKSRLLNLVNWLVLCLLLTSMTAAASARKVKSDRISPVLRAEIDGLRGRREGEKVIPVIVQVRPEFFERVELVRRLRGEKNLNALGVIHGYQARLTAGEIRSLLESDLVEYITRDEVIRSTKKNYGNENSGDDGKDPSTLSRLATIGADQVHAMGVEGGGVNVAVLDSGIGNHKDIARRSRIRKLADFTVNPPYITEKKTADDEYGHGTHVAGIIGGDGKKSSRRIVGVAPKVKFVNVKVLGDDGNGRTSDLLRAIDWVIANKTRERIDVANLSVGHPPIESSKTDPLCYAVERMVHAGVVTVVSAGNLGKTTEFPKIYGGIKVPEAVPR